MRKIFLSLALLLTMAAMVNANIVDVICDDDGDGGISMDPNQSIITGLGTKDLTLTMECVQHEALAHVQGDFIADDPNDPSVFIVEDIVNDTDFAWTGYEFYIGMSKIFTISELEDYIIAPAGWTWNVNQPTGPQEMPNGGTGYVGSVIFSGGDPIAINSEASFGLKVSFAGSIAFCTEQIPTPEPISLALMALGGLGLIRRR